jgi:hypothetical protein
VVLPVESLFHESLGLESLEEADNLEIGDGNIIGVLIQVSILLGNKGSLCDYKKKVKDDKINRI